MFSPLDPKACYNPERDGDLKTYMKEHNGITSCALFRGCKHYIELWDQGYLEPNGSVVHILSNGTRDENFRVLGKYEIRGMSVHDQSGRSGIHDPREILKNAIWEAQDLNREKISLSR